jgi:hypothetical protein
MARREQDSPAACVAVETISLVKDDVRFNRLRFPIIRELAERPEPRQRLQRGHRTPVDVLSIEFVNRHRSLCPLLESRRAAELVRMPVSQDDEADVAERNAVP